MRKLTHLAAGAMAVMAAPAAHAATHYATPATLSFVLAQAKAGDSIRLSAGSYGNVALPPRDNSPAITVDATGVTVRSLTVRNTAGWVWKGGTIDTPLPPQAWFNVMVDGARRFELIGATLTGGQTGVMVTRGSADVLLKGNTATGLRSDGFNIATANRVTLDGNVCKSFEPVDPVFDARGKMLKDGTHPDCIMLWSEAGKPPTSDITIVNNRMSGRMQGITTFWHPQLGRDKVYRVTVANNTVDVGFWHGIMMDDTPGSLVRNNRVTTMAGARMVGYPYSPIRTWLKASGPGTISCGNVVGDYPGGAGTGACPAQAGLPRALRGLPGPELKSQPAGG